MRTIAIAKKVFKELLRDKRTFALMFIAPILIMWLLNIVFSADTTENIRIGAVDVPTKVEEVMKNVDNVSLEGITTKEEAEKKLKDGLLATPVKRSEIIFGYTISYGFLAIIQTIVITLSAIYLLNIEVAGSLVYVIIVNMLLALGALALGMLLSTAAKSEFQVMQFIPLVIIPQMFFTGIVPVENMGKVAVYISKVLPVTYSGDGLSKIILEGKNLLDIKGDIIALTIFFVVLITLNIIGLKRYRKV